MKKSCVSKDYCNTVFISEGFELFTNLMMNGITKTWYIICNNNLRTVLVVLPYFKYKFDFL